MPCPSRAAALDALRFCFEAEAGRRFWSGLAGPPAFACVIASTDTAEIPGISAAGETPEKRRFTAALDSEFLVFGRPLTLPEIPRNPLGPPSPVVITKAALDGLGVVPLIVDAGTRVPPLTPRLDLGGVPGRCITTGNAVDLPPGFRERCREAGRYLASRAAWAVIAESVPGGTTTAQAVLEALGVPAGGRVSSSMPGGNHGLKAQVVDQALAAASLPDRPSGEEVVRAVGDPMQAAVAWMALEASRSGPVVLAGGTQMAAVAGLALRLWQGGEPGEPGRMCIATTRWVAEDPAADLTGILSHLPRRIPAVACGLDFTDSQDPGLRRYEEGLVKEGVGAGGAACAALAAGRTPRDLVHAIEEVVRALPPA